MMTVPLDDQYRPGFSLGCHMTPLGCFLHHGRWPRARYRTAIVSTLAGIKYGIPPCCIVRYVIGGWNEGSHQAHQRGTRYYVGGVTVPCLWFHSADQPPDTVCDCA